MLTASYYLKAVRSFGLALEADAERMDTEEATLASWYARFVADDLHLGWSPRQPLSGREFCEALATLAEGSGAFGFVALQQFVANASLADRVPRQQAWPRVGVAFGHLRNPQGPSLRWDGHCARGLIPWMTGAGLFSQVILGMRGPGQEEVYALVDATDRALFRHSAPLDLIACSSTRTVSVYAHDLPIEEAAILKEDPPGTLAQNDAHSVIYQTPLMVGCVRACLKHIRHSPRIGASEKAQCEAATEALLQRVYAAFEDSTPETGQQLRAELGDFCVRLARLVVMASGGVGLVRDHPAQRLYREALLYSVMAQTDSILHQAFREVFP